MSAAGPRGWIGGALRGGPAGPGGVVVKFGGSLFALPDWPERAAALVGGVGGPVTLVVGGGPVVEGLREIDAVRPVAPALVHRLAIDGMAIGGRLVAASLGLPVSPRPAGDAATVLDVAAWLASAGSGRVDVPESWDVTSDSLAAVVAGRHGLALLLAKSVPPPCAEIDTLSREGWVDRWFPRAAAGLESVAWTAPAP